MSEDSTPGSRSFTSPRALKQLGLAAAGSAFLLASIAVSRRAIARKTISSVPSTFQPNIRPPIRAGDTLRGGASDKKSEPALDAAEALGLATLNVLSFAIFATGGVAFACDLSSVEDLKYYSRRKLYGPAGKPNEDTEKEMAEWVAGVLGKSGVNIDEAEKKEKEEREEAAAKEVAKEEEQKKKSWYRFW